MTETFIRLFGPSMEEDDFPKETLNVEATLSNGFLPAAYLEVGSIKEPIIFPAGIEASNITIPTEVLGDQIKTIIYGRKNHSKMKYHKRNRISY